MLDESSMAEAAEQFARAHVSNWDYYGYRMRVISAIDIADGAPFGYNPTRDPERPGVVPLVGGNIPIMVTRDGVCRFVGFDEYFALEAASTVPPDGA